jgi:hypothetical protein
MTGTRASTLLALMDHIERFTLHRVWTDLTDDELFWEPAAGAWGVRPRRECRTATPLGGGDWVADFDTDSVVAAAMGLDVEPMTTIGWLLWHVGSVPGRMAQLDILGGDRTLSSGWTSPYLTPHPIFTTATAATEALRSGWQALGAALRDTDDHRMEQLTATYTYAPEPPRHGLLVVGAPGPEAPGYVAVTGALHEISHHGAQMCVLRDLHRWRGPAATEP